ncbi:hypothetical protein BU14_0497s0009 [Porphyra umbilicalis]|uniref:Uncharacterized protein n=1 Tax=Porphyra umbilicalis TaxID=2786 RepID=A0A1X6NTF9_PORUM|nr:hypothetical protein BU14_0497s0009 [Porphyra umbilicalis]|eukprot:OSX71845.1 hypothetical protein BU14_0497s0009 [Porphyra umbilicalis]
MSRWDLVLEGGGAAGPAGYVPPPLPARGQFPGTPAERGPPRPRRRARRVAPPLSPALLLTRAVCAVGGDPGRSGWALRAPRAPPTAAPRLAATRAAPVPRRRAPCRAAPRRPPAAAAAAASPRRRRVRATRAAQRALRRGAGAATSGPPGRRPRRGGDKPQ